MNFKSSNLLIAVIVIILVYVFVIAFTTYTPKGDLKGVLAERNSVLEKYNTPNDIADRLHEIITYKERKVRWPHYLALAILFSAVILFIIGQLTFINCAIATAFIFLAIDLPRRFDNAHVLGKQSVEGDMLYAKLKSHLTF
jgi:hypothetical protein